MITDALRVLTSVNRVALRTLHTSVRKLNARRRYTSILLLSFFVGITIQWLLPVVSHPLGASLALGDSTTFSSSLNCTQQYLHSSMTCPTSYLHADIANKLSPTVLQAHTVDQIGHKVLSNVSSKLISSTVGSISWFSILSCAPQSAFCDVGNFSFDDLALQLLKSGLPPTQVPPNRSSE